MKYCNFSGDVGEAYSSPITPTNYYYGNIFVTRLIPTTLHWNKILYYTSGRAQLRPLTCTVRDEF